MNAGSDRLREFKADLHIHTCLSPCAELEMSPKNIVREAKRKGLDVIGICDHNSAENVAAMKTVAEREGLSVLGGMEVTTKEEVHVLAYFDSNESLLSLQEIVYEHLHGTNNEKVYGEQVIINEFEEVVGFNKKLLIGATDITIEKLVELIHQRKGVAVAAHVDRAGFGILAQLGFIPTGLSLDALEIVDLANRSACGQTELPFITSSDAHRLEDIGRRSSRFLMREASVEELRKCFRKQEGRTERL